MLDVGDASVLTNSKTVVESVYSVPYANHAPMEPQNCIVRLEKDRALVVAPLQQPGGVPRLVMNMTGVARENVSVQMTRVGGGFDRLDTILCARASTTRTM